MTITVSNEIKTDKLISKTSLNNGAELQNINVLMFGANTKLLIC